MDANRPAPGPGGYGGLGAGSIVSKNIQPLLEADPRQIGPYAVRGRLGQGAMGSVYLGFAPTGQAFALKVLRQDFAADRDFRKRFTREIAAARAVHSPFVNAVTDADPNAATPWLASYFIPGPPLSSAVQLAGPFAPRSVAHLGVGIGLALQAIHKAGIVHRDLKPANVLVASDGPRVIDFGIARAVDASMLTATGMRLGTPSFMAPEQVAGSDVDAPADVWAVGGMLIYAATGRTPFGDGNAMAILYRVENHDPDLQGLEPALASIAARCLAKDPADRPTPTQLVEMCRAALSGGLEGHPALRGSDVTGWLPAAVSRDLAARAVELANVGQVVSGAAASAAPAGGATAPTGTGMSTGGGGKTGVLGGLLRRKGATGTGMGAAQSGQPGDHYSQGAAMSGGQGQYGQPGGQTGGGQYGPPPGPGQAYDPDDTGGQYGAPPPQQQHFGGPAADGQFGQQQGGFGATGGQFGQQGDSGSPQPAAPAWGPSGPSGSDMPTTITPPNVPAPEPQGPAWRAATASQTPAPSPEPEPEPERAGIAGLPAGFTPIGEEAKRLAEAAEVADSIAAATSSPDTGFGPPSGSSFGQQPANTSSSDEQPPSPFASPQPAAAQAESESSDTAAAATTDADADAAFGPPKPANPVIPQIAEPTFATNFNIPVAKAAPDPASDEPDSPPASSGISIPKIAEPTFATNFNIPVVTPQSEDDAPAASSGISIPKIAEPTFATNFNIPVIKADSGDSADADDPDAPAARTGTPAVSIPSIAEPAWATGFMPAVKPEPPAQEDAAPSDPAPSDAAPKPVTHAPPIPPHLQQPMTPPKGFGAPSSQPTSQPQPVDRLAQTQQIGHQPAEPQPVDRHAQTQQIAQQAQPQPVDRQAQTQQIPHQPSAQQAHPQPVDPQAQTQQIGQQPPAQQSQSPFAAPQPPIAPSQGQPQHGDYQQPGHQQQQGYQQQQSPYAQQQSQPRQGFQQQSYQQHQQQPQHQFGGSFQQPPAPPQPQGGQHRPAQGPAAQHHQPFAANPTPTPSYQNQPAAQFHPDHNPQAGGHTIVPLPPPMESPYGVPERSHGPGPADTDTDTAKGWSAWSGTKRIAVLATAGIVVVGGILGAILALSGGGTSKSAADSGAPSPATTTAMATGPIGAQQGAPGARDVVLRGLYVAAAARDFHTVCASQTVAAQQGAAKSDGWNGQGDPMPLCEKYFQDNWSTISADYLRGRQVTDVKVGPNASTMIVTVNDPPPSGGGTTRSFTVVWQDAHWLLQAASA